MTDGRHPAWPHAMLAACGGFLVAVLWFDLMFDVQVRGHAAAAPLPDAVVASIAQYYRRVTTDAHPMQQLIGMVMALTVLGSAWTLHRPGHRWLRWTAMASCVVPIGLAGVRVLPNAVRLGMRTDTLAGQSALARAIYADHVLCLGVIAIFTAAQIALAAGRATR